MEPIKHIKIRKDMKVSELVNNMKNAGFGAGKIGEASEIMKKMFNDKRCTVFLGVAGAMIPAGMKEIIMDLLDDTEVFVTTGANLTHDLIEAIGESHYKGEEFSDDKKLNEEGIDRIYNVFMKNSVYEKLEDFFEKNFSEFVKCKTIKELLWKIGELSPGIGVLKKCYEKKIPIFCPGIADSGIGLMMWSMTAVKKTLQSYTDSSATHPNQGSIIEGKGKTNIDVFEDMKEIIDIAWSAEKRGIIYIGGGLPKNFIQQSLQFSKGADYGIQITTDRTEPGGSSGAPLREGISWGKMNKDAEFVDVFCDATIALPLIFAGIK
jgi:deoxyhypusine synthase